MNIAVDTTAAVQALRQYQDQLPFAVSLGLNNLAIAAADRQRADMPSRFTIRNPNVLKYGIVRTEKATKASLASAVGVSTQRTGNREAFGYLNRFQAGGQKRSIAGTTVAVPEEARRTKRGIVQASQRIPALQLKRVGKQIVGLKRTFLIKPKSGRAAALILQRVGKGKRGQVRVLYVLERQVPIAPILHLDRNAIVAAQQDWPRIMAAAAAQAIRTRR